jgi:hypothetical protein
MRSELLKDKFITSDANGRRNVYERRPGSERRLQFDDPKGFNEAAVDQCPAVYADFARMRPEHLGEVVAREVDPMMVNRETFCSTRIDLMLRGWGALVLRLR